MKIYSDISLIGVSQSVSQGQNTYVLVKDSSDNTIRRTQLQVNGNVMDSNGNIATALTNVLVGPSSSGTDPNNLVASSSGTATGSISTGTVWVVNNNPDDTTKNGLSYIFKNTPGAGQWYQLATLNQAGADIRYVKIVSDTTQDISSSLTISGSSVTFSSSLYWTSGSEAVFPGAGVTASVVVLGSDNKLYITGAYGIGGGTGTPGAPVNSVQFNDNNNLGGNETFTFIPPIAGNSSNPISSSLLNLLGRETLSGSLILRNPANISGSIYTASAWTSSLTLQVIGTSSFSGSLFISGAANITSSANRLLVLDSTGLVQTITGSLVPKSGKIDATTFNLITNRSKFATASLSSSMGNTDYGVSITGVDARIWTIENKTTSSFVIDTNSIVNLTGDVYWIATPAYNPS
jgi:hypothetical protein